MNTDGSSPTRVTKDDGDDFGPSFVDADTLVFGHGGGRIDRINTDGTGAAHLTQTAGYQAPSVSAGTGRIAVAGPELSLLLLRHYVPELRYHPQEPYRADSAATMTDNYVSDEDGHTNLLKRMVGSQPQDSDTILAASNPGLGFDQLALYYLDETYPTGVEAVGPNGNGDGGDYIDAANSTSEDAARLHELDAYRDRIYGRVTQGPDGKTWIQYWLFYYYNEGILGFGDHEADWEMIQIGLNSQYQPDVATYAQHGAGDQDACSWDLVPKVSGGGPDGPPVVYVDLGSHASSFEGLYEYELGERVRPRVEEIEATGWVRWPGRWGGSNSVIRSPGRQGAKWSDPSAFDADAEPCPLEDQPNAARSPAQASHIRRAGRERPLSSPGVHARRVGSHVVVQYRLRRPKLRPRRPLGIFATVHGARVRALPTGGSCRLRNRRGRLRIQLPRGRGPYVVRATVHARNGASSRIVTVPVR